MDFAPFVSFGFGHITTAGALDHILFLIALAAIHRWSEWRQALVVVTAFTVGHSVTLALAVFRPDVLPPAGMVEFLIPLTILLTGIENVITRGTRESRVRVGRRALLAGGFGLVHGAGFAGYLSEILPGSIAIPLVGFNLGIELGQVVVLALIFAALAAIDRLMHIVASGRESLGFRLRVTSLSLLVAAMGGLWVVERVSW